jgi:hypothetical protein
MLENLVFLDMKSISGNTKNPHFFVCMCVNVLGSGIIRSYSLIQTHSMWNAGY